jgi:hypothetical protein
MNNKGFYKTAYSRGDIMNKQLQRFTFLVICIATGFFQVNAAHPQEQPAHLSHFNHISKVYRFTADKFLCGSEGKLLPLFPMFAWNGKGFPDSIDLTAERGTQISTFLKEYKGYLEKLIELLQKEDFSRLEDMFATKTEIRIARQALNLREHISSSAIAKMLALMEQVAPEEIKDIIGLLQKINGLIMTHKFNPYVRELNNKLLNPSAQGNAGTIAFLALTFLFHPEAFFTANTFRLFKNVGAL